MGTKCGGKEQRCRSRKDGSGSTLPRRRFQRRKIDRAFADLEIQNGWKRRRLMAPRPAHLQSTAEQASGRAAAAQCDVRRHVDILTIVQEFEYARSAAAMTPNRVGVARKDHDDSAGAKVQRLGRGPDKLGGSLQHRIEE